MPRRSRIDTPDSRHHIMCRGIEKRKVFDIDADREHFLERLTGYALWYNRAHRRNGHLFQKGKRGDLSGGGLIRSAGGWEAVKVLKKERIFQKSDERILGNGEFVEGVLSSPEEAMEKRYALGSRGFDLEKTATRVAEVLGMKEEDIWAKGRYCRIVEARSLLCYWAVRALGVTMSFLAVRLGISIPAVSKSVSRGKELAEARGYSLLKS